MKNELQEISPEAATEITGGTSLVGALIDAAVEAAKEFIRDLGRPTA